MAYYYQNQNRDFGHGGYSNPYGYRPQEYVSDGDSYSSSSYYSSPHLCSNRGGNHEEPVDIFIAGSCLGNDKKPGPRQAGFGYCIVGYPYWNRSRTCQFPYTNNRAELEAAITAINFAIDKGFRQITIHTHSEYLEDNIYRLDEWIQRGWRHSKGRVKNRDLWEELNVLRGECDVQYEFHYRDSSFKFDEIAYRLAYRGASNAEALIH